MRHTPEACALPIRQRSRRDTQVRSCLRSVDQFCVHPVPLSVDLFQLFAGILQTGHAIPVPCGMIFLKSKRPPRKLFPYPLLRSWSLESARFARPLRGSLHLRLRCWTPGRAPWLEPASLCPWMSLEPGEDGVVEVAVGEDDGPVVDGSISFDISVGATRFGYDAGGCGTVIGLVEKVDA